MRLGPKVGPEGSGDGLKSVNQHNTSTRRSRDKGQELDGSPRLSQ